MIEDIKVTLLQLQAAGLFRHLDLLAGLLANHQDVRLVVHSSWRHTHTDAELRQVFGSLANRVVGATDRALDRQLSIFDFVVRRKLEPNQYRVLGNQVELLVDPGHVVINGCWAASKVMQGTEVKTFVGRFRAVGWLRLVAEKYPP